MQRNLRDQRKVTNVVALKRTDQGLRFKSFASLSPSLPLSPNLSPPPLCLVSLLSRVICCAFPLGITATSVPALQELWDLSGSPSDWLQLSTPTNSVFNVMNSKSTMKYSNWSS